MYMSLVSGPQRARGVPQGQQRPCWLSGCQVISWLSLAQDTTPFLCKDLAGMQMAVYEGRLQSAEEDLLEAVLAMFKAVPR